MSDALSSSVHGLPRWCSGVDSRGVWSRPIIREAPSIRFVVGDLVDFGIVSGKSTHYFTLANESRRTVEISDVVTSCGCAAAVIQRASLLPPGGQCVVEFALTVRAGKRRSATITALSTDGDVASLRVSAQGRSSRWRAIHRETDDGRVWLGDERTATVQVESMVSLAELKGPPHAEWVCLDSGRVKLSAGDIERRPDGTFMASCDAHIWGSHAGQFAATVICQIEGSDVPIALTWEVVSPLGLGAQELMVPISSTPTTFALSVAQGLSVVDLVRPSSEGGAGQSVAVQYVDPVSEAGPSLRVHVAADASARSLDIVEVQFVLEERATRRTFKTPVTSLFLSQTKGDR